MTLIELLAAITGLACVYLTTKEKISSFYVGFVNIALFIYMFIDAKLYADATLQVVFAVLSFYGIYVWLSGNKNTKSVAITRDITRNETLISLAIGILASFGWAALLTKYTDASVPYIDAPLAVASVIAQWFLSKKVIQNWLIWITVDVFSVGMYAYKGLYITSGLYAIFLMLAAKGFMDWRKENSYLATKTNA